MILRAVDYMRYAMISRDLRKDTLKLDVLKRRTVEEALACLNMAPEEQVRALLEASVDQNLRARALPYSACASSTEKMEVAVSQALAEALRFLQQEPVSES